jgi:hypothetical protein
MKVRMLTGFGTADRNYHTGDEIDLEQDEAKALVEAGYAEPLGSAPAKRASTRKAPAKKKEE